MKGLFDVKVRFDGVVIEKRKLRSVDDLDRLLGSLREKLR